MSLKEGAVLFIEEEVTENRGHLKGVCSTATLLLGF